MTIALAELWLRHNPRLRDDSHGDLANTTRVYDVCIAHLFLRTDTHDRTVVFALGNGGTAGLIYIYIVVTVFFFFINISMGEMASMAPTAGGQYHWISEFAPRSKQKILSYFIGWLSSLGWQSGVTICSFLAATEIQGLIVLNSDTYVYERW